VWTPIYTDLCGFHAGLCRIHKYFELVYRIVSHKKNFNYVVVRSCNLLVDMNSNDLFKFVGFFIFIRLFITAYSVFEIFTPSFFMALEVFKEKSKKMYFKIRKED
jgi:hypothetical protein